MHTAAAYLRKYIEAEDIRNATAVSVPHVNLSMHSQSLPAANHDLYLLYTLPKTYHVASDKVGIFRLSRRKLCLLHFLQSCYQPLFNLVRLPELFLDERTVE